MGSRSETTSCRIVSSSWRWSPQTSIRSDGKRNNGECGKGKTKSNIYCRRQKTEKHFFEINQYQKMRERQQHEKLEQFGCVFGKWMKILIELREAVAIMLFEVRCTVHLVKIIEKKGYSRMIVSENVNRAQLQTQNSTITEVILCWPYGPSGDIGRWLSGSLWASMARSSSWVGEPAVDFLDFLEGWLLNIQGLNGKLSANWKLSKTLL